MKKDTTYPEKSRTLSEMIKTVENLLSEKGNDYGKTYLKVAAMLSVKPQYSILVRILEKCARCDNLLRRDNSEVPLRENFLDIAAYAILAAFESERL
jgi:hypothetical protein